MRATPQSSSPALRLVMTLDVVLIPAMEVLKFLQQHEPIPLSERNSATIVRLARERNYFLERQFKVAEPAGLLAAIVKSQCEFNFVSPLLRLHDEDGWQDMRGNFCRILSRSPYDLIRDGKPTALELCMNGGQRSEGIYSYSPALVDSRNIEPTDLQKADNLTQALYRAGLKAVANLRSRRVEDKEGYQLEVLAYCVILPTLFGIKPFTVPDSEEVYAAAVERNGDFYFPVPKFLEDVAVPSED
jgi:hypothetical protein